MPTPIKFKADFYPGAFYHMLCKSIDGILLFRDRKDYGIFKQKVYFFLLDFFELWSYNLLSNHTHFIIKVKSVDSILLHLSSVKSEDQTLSMKRFIEQPADAGLFSEMIERQVNRFLVSYSFYYNDKYTRSGGLFRRPFRRVQIEDEAYLQQAIIYCHANAEKHRITDDFRKYPYSSYQSIIQGNDEYLAVNAVINFFGSIDKMIEAHRSQVEYYYKTKWHL